MKATVSEQLISNADRVGDRTAIVFDDFEMTWRALADESARLAAFLKAEGVGAGDHVVLFCSNRPAFMIWLYAILHRGAVAVMVNTGLVGDGLRYAVEKSAASMLIVEQAILDEKQGDLAPILGDRRLVAFPDEAHLATIAAAHAPAPLVAVKGSDPCTIIYTSGTTGFPKPVLNCHTAYLKCGGGIAGLLDLTIDDRFMVVLPLFHTNPQMYGAMSCLVTACTLVIRPKFSASQFFHDASRFRATVFSYVGTVLSILANRVTEPQHDHQLRACVGGGCPLPVWEIVEERFGVAVHEMYGMTETGGWATGNSVTRRRKGTCGLARADMEIAVVDDADRPVPPNTLGEIVVRPREPFVMLLGYFGDPAAAWGSAANFWFHTGDSGSIDKDGFVSFRGRTKEIIRRGGENISPAEIEGVLMQNPAIIDAAVVAVPDAIYGEEIKALVVTAGAMEPAAVRDFLKGKVADFMLPRYVQFLSAIPKTETHKVRRDVLRTMVDGQIDLKSS